MQKFASIITKVIKTDPLQICNKSHPTIEDYSSILHLYQYSSTEKKKKLVTNLNRKLTKETGNKEILNLLLLWDVLSDTYSQVIVSYPESLLACYENKSKLKPMSKKQKNQLAESNFILFYLRYLRQKNRNAYSPRNTDVTNFRDGLDYCQLALNGLKLIIHHDFIIQYVLAYSELKTQAKLVTQNILRRSCEELSFLIRFVDKWNHIIAQDNDDSVYVNDIYEQLIFVSKNISKFEHLNSKIKGTFKFPRYQINKKLNQTIQRVMLGKENEKRSFYTQKRLKTESDFNHEQQAQITQSQIMMKFKL